MKLASQFNMIMTFGDQQRWYQHQRNMPGMMHDAVHNHLQAAQHRFLAGISAIKNLTQCGRGQHKYYSHQQQPAASTVRSSLSS
jgi:hypothetical protein